jgi:hypothetical protein
MRRDRPVLTKDRFLLLCFCWFCLGFTPNIMLQTEQRHMPLS